MPLAFRGAAGVAGFALLAFRGLEGPISAATSRASCASDWANVRSAPRSVDVIEPGRWLAPNPRPPVARGVRARLAGAAGAADLALEVGTIAPPGDRTIAPPGERTMAPPGERTIAPPRDAAGAAADFLARGFRAGFAAGAAAGAAFRALGFRAGFAAGAAAGAFRALGFAAGAAAAATGILAPPLTPRVFSNRVT